MVPFSELATQTLFPFGVMAIPPAPALSSGPTATALPVVPFEVLTATTVALLELT